MNCKFFWHLKTFLLLVSASFLFSSCSYVVDMKNSALEQLAEFIPIQVIEDLDQQSWKAIQASKEIIDDKAARDALKVLSQPIIDEAIRQGAPRQLSWSFHIVNEAELNAFALPGGTIAVNSGLIFSSESGVEVIGVLGHEVAHVLARHGMESMILRSGTSFVLSLLMGELGQFSALALDKLATLGHLKFSRDHEREADTLGAQLLNAAQYPSIGLSQFFGKMLQKQEALQGTNTEVPAWAEKSLSLLSTHPMSAERAQRLEELVSGNPHKKLQPEAMRQYTTLRSQVIESLSPAQKVEHEKLIHHF